MNKEQVTALADKLADETQPLIVAEIAQSHDGSLGMCHAYIDALAGAGADAIKFQTHIAAAESTLDEQFRVKFSYQDQTRFEYWQRMEFSPEQWAELKRHADACGIGFLSTPFSVAAVELLKGIGVEVWKVGSGDTAGGAMLEAMLTTGKPLIVSTGMSGWQEIDATVERLRSSRTLFALLQCTSKYPTPLEEVGLNNLAELQERYGCRVGLSDHSASMSPSLTAIARGFPLIEVHATFDHRMFGPDVPASLTVEQIAELVRFARDVHTLDAYPVDKDAMVGTLGAQKRLFGRSVALTVDRPASYQLAEADLTPKKPGDGIPWANRDQVVGRRLVQSVSANRLLKSEDFE